MGDNDSLRGAIVQIAVNQNLPLVNADQKLLKHGGKEEEEEI